MNTQLKHDIKELYGDDYIKLNAERHTFKQRLEGIILKSLEELESFPELHEEFVSICELSLRHIWSIVQNPIKITNEQLEEYKNLPLVINRFRNLLKKSPSP